MAGDDPSRWPPPSPEERLEPVTPPETGDSPWWRDAPASRPPPPPAGELPPAPGWAAAFEDEVAADAADPRVRWGTGDALLGLALTLVAPAVVAVAVVVATGWDSFDDLRLWQMALLQVPLWAGLLGAPLWSTYSKGRRSLADDFGFRVRWRGAGEGALGRFMRSDPVVGVGAGIGGQIGLIIVVAILYSLLGIDPEQVGRTAEELTDEARSTIDVILLVLIVGLAAPVLEELFYRGLWLRALARRWGTTRAVILSSAVFAAIHFQVYDLPALFGFGLIAAALTVRSGRLGPAIWAHLAFNLTAVISLLAT